MEIYVTETGKTAVAMVTDRAYFLPSVAAARSVVRHQNEPHDIFCFATISNQHGMNNPG